MKFILPCPKIKLHNEIHNTAQTAERSAQSVTQ